MPISIWWAIHKKPLPITGTGEETRDFTFVEDIVDGTLRLGVVPEAIGDAFNLASNKETKIADIASMVNAITGNENGIEMGRGGTGTKSRSGGLPLTKPVKSSATSRK